MADANELSKKITKSLKLLEKNFSPLDNRILVGLSGGKDSLAVFDLCQRVFGKNGVVPFFMTFIPDLRVIKDMHANPIKRFDIKEIFYFPDSVFFSEYKRGMYSWESSDRRSLPDLTRGQIYPYIAKIMKIPKMALGIKKNDNIRMRQQIEHNRLFGGAVLPIGDWTTSDVLMYLRVREIEIPKQYYEGFRGVDLTDASILYLAKHYPDDLDRIEKYFPFVKAVVKQYEYFNLKLKVHKI